MVAGSNPAAPTSVSRSFANILKVNIVTVPLKNGVLLYVEHNVKVAGEVLVLLSLNLDLISGVGPSV